MAKEQVINTKVLKQKLDEALKNNPQDIAYEIAKESLKYPTIKDFLIKVRTIWVEGPHSKHKLFCLNSKKKINAFNKRHGNEIFVHFVFRYRLCAVGDTDETKFNFSFRTFHNILTDMF